MATNQYLLISGRQSKYLYQEKSEEEKHPITLHTWIVALINTTILKNTNFAVKKKVYPLCPLKCPKAGL